MDAAMGEPTTSERLRSVAELAGLSSGFEALFEAAPSPLLVVTAPDYIIIAANDAYARATMTTREAIVGRALFDVFPGNADDLSVDSPRMLRASLERVVEQRRLDQMPVIRYDMRRPAALGSGFEERWWQARNAPVFGRNGEVVCIIHQIEDVTAPVRTEMAAVQAERRAETALRIAEERRELALAAAEMGAWDYDLVTDVCHFDARARELYNLPSDTIDHRPEGVASVVHPDDVGPMFDAVRHASDVNGDHRYDIDYRIAQADGQYRWLRACGKAEFEGEGAARRAVRIVGASRDVTVEKEIEHRHQRQHNKLVASEGRLLVDLAAAQQLQAFSTKLMSEQQPDALYAQLLDAAMALMRADAASVHALASDGRRLSLLASRNFHPDSAAFWHWLDASSRSSGGVALATNARVLIEDIETSAEMAGTRDLDEYRRCGIRATQSTPLLSRDGKRVGMLSTHWHQPHQPAPGDFDLFDVLSRQAADLIERNRIDVALRESEARLRTTVTERDELLKELHHRVKNNLQVVTSLLEIQERQSADPKAASLLSDAKDRVAAIAAIHELLYQSGMFSEVDLSAYARRLLRHVVSLYDPNGGLDASVVGEEIKIDLARAVPIGLLLNELISNACKHAFGSNDAGRLQVSLRKDDGHIHLRVSDNGVGLRNEFSNGTGQTLGLQLVGMLTKQLGGSVTFDATNGTSVEVRVPADARTA